MNKIAQLKDNIRICYEICDDIDAGRIRIDDSISIKKILKEEFLKFCIYLALIDDKIAPEEIDLINEVFDTTFNRKNTTEIILFKTDKLNTQTFPVTVPIPFKHFVLADIKKSEGIRYQESKSKLLFDTYELLGQTLIASDSKIDENQIKALTNYTILLNNNLRSYGLSSRTIEKNTMIEIQSKESNTALQENKEAETKSVEELLESLNELTGLDNVKKEINSLVNLIKINKMREEQGIKTANVSKHMVFSGNPGTGKTTVARIVAQIYKGLGVLSQGQLIEVDRSGLVAGYVGQTAILTKQMLDKAKGGVLFVDEAYTLSKGGSESDFGREAIDTLLKGMEDNRDDLVVIVAGYTDLMEEFLDSNPGLKSRFNKFIAFDDYLPEQLLEILENMCKKQDFILEEKAKSYLLKEFQTLSASPDFANARTARNIFEYAITAQATRLLTQEQRITETVKEENEELKENTTEISETTENIEANNTEKEIKETYNDEALIDVSDKDILEKKEQHVVSEIDGKVVFTKEDLMTLKMVDFLGYVL